MAGGRGQWQAHCKKSGACARKFTLVDDAPAIHPSAIAVQTLEPQAVGLNYALDDGGSEAANIA